MIEMSYKHIVFPVITRHDRSGITNKMKKLKTIQERNSLRESSNNPENLPQTLKTARKSGSLKAHSVW